MDAVTFANHHMFYVICQSAFYTLCFRLDDIASMEGGVEFLQQLQLEMIVACRLRPLKVPALLQIIPEIDPSYCRPAR